MTKAARITYLLSFGTYPYGEVARMADASTGYVSQVVNSRPNATVRQAVSSQAERRRYYTSQRQRAKLKAKFPQRLTIG